MDWTRTGHGFETRDLMIPDLFRSRYINEILSSLLLSLKASFVVRKIIVTTFHQTRVASSYDKGHVDAPMT